MTCHRRTIWRRDVGPIIRTLTKDTKNDAAAAMEVIQLTLCSSSTLLPSWLRSVKVLIVAFDLASFTSFRHFDPLPFFSGRKGPNSWEELGGKDRRVLSN